MTDDSKIIEAVRGCCSLTLRLMHGRSSTFDNNSGNSGCSFGGCEAGGDSRRDGEEKASPSH